MYTEMSKREELSDAELDGVSGGDLERVMDTGVWYVIGALDTVKKVIHDAAQGIADATK
jgi:hypothetical protein